MSDLFATLWTVAHQTPLSRGFTRQEYWSGLSFPSAGVLPDPGIEPMSPALAGRFFTTEPPGKPMVLCSNNMVKALGSWLPDWGSVKARAFGQAT